MAHPSHVRVTGPLALFAPGFAEELSRQGYRSKPVVDQLRLLAHLSRWLCSKGLDAADLEASVLNEFLSARRSQGYAMWLSPKAMAPLTGYLRGIGVMVCEPTSVSNPTVALLTRYSEYLLGTRGLTTASARGYVDMVRPFVSGRLVNDELDWAGLRAPDVHNFVLTASRGRSIGSAKLMTTALRSLLGYAHIEGLISAPLQEVVPAVAGWRLAGYLDHCSLARCHACSPPVIGVRQGGGATSRC